jgi:restriction system protein
MAMYETLLNLADSFGFAPASRPVAAVGIAMGLVALAALMVALAVALVHCERRQAPSREFARRFGIDVPAEVRVTRRLERSPHNGYRLAFPAWNVPTEDGRRDARSLDHGVSWGTCTLEVDSYALSCRDPATMVGLVSSLRTRGCVIDPCDQEREKAARVSGERSIARSLGSAADVWQAYQDHPTDFEKLVAELFRRQGYESHVTPMSGDGGYDVELRREGTPGVEGIVECKCFRPDHHVGRPLVQKLVGANQGPHSPQARTMALVTTSSFSPAAEDYARQAGVRLVGGTELAGLLVLWGLASDQTSDTTLALGDWALTPDDLACGYPPDWFDETNDGTGAPRA